MNYKKIKVIISGGGTGGHIFPAVSIANKLRELNPETEILFVGAEGRMEMEKVPAAGFKIVGLPISGLQRGKFFSNLSLPFKVCKSLRRARKILKEFKPDIAIGVGGYASAPLLFAAEKLGIPTLIQEQNSYAGLANKILGKKAGKICVAYEGMEKFFPAKKIVLTGNPIRSDIHPYSFEEKQAGIEYYGFTKGLKHLLVIGGSLGSRTLNNAMMKWISEGAPGGESVEILWQCGKFYKKEVDAFVREHPCATIKHTDFISRMDLAYAMSDVLISRSGASSISEICACGKAAVFVPSPNVAEDHQTHNAMALVNRKAALIVSDSMSSEKLLPTALWLLNDEAKRDEISSNAAAMGLLDAAHSIVDEIYKLI